MTQSIDPIRLRAAAEHLEWVLRQYPDSERVQALLHGLLPVIEEVKAGRIEHPVDAIPFARSSADGEYVPYRNPDVGEAYARFATQMSGGPSAADLEIESYIEARKAAL